MKYSIHYTQPSAHFLEIELSISHVVESSLALQMPSWRPGRYELQDFAKNVFSFQAFGASGEVLPVEQTSKDRWIVNCPDSTEVRVCYRYYANQMDAGGTYVDEHQLYINWITCALLVEERAAEPIDIALQLPEDYEIATSLAHQGNQLQAPDFETLVDAPLIASNSLQHRTYEEGGCLFHIWIQGDCQPDWQKIVHDFQRFTKEQIATFGGFPCQEYHFLVQVLPYRHYHGVEHQYSTVIVLGPSEHLMGKLYDELLGVSSHELYHTWNVTRLRPKEMVPYQWHTYNYFKTGFVAEGITTYYGDLMLVRSGVWDVEAYLKEVNLLIKRHMENTSRLTASLTDSSWDLWLDGYGSRQPKRRASIYVKGALAAMLLDWKIRRASHGAKSLDDLMNAMWSKYTKEGYSLEDYQEEVALFLGKEESETYFRQCIEGTADIIPLLSEEAAWMGLEWKEVAHEGNCERKFGFRLQKKQGQWHVAFIMPDAPAWKILSIGDEVVAINQRRLQEDNIEQLLNMSEDLVLSIFRNNILQNKRLKESEETYFKTYQVAIGKRNGEGADKQATYWLSSVNS